MRKLMINMPSEKAVREEVAAIQYNDIVSWMLDDEKVMSEVVVALHTDIPIIEHGALIKAILSQNPADLIRARSVIDSAIEMAAQNRANRAKIISTQL